MIILIPFNSYTPLMLGGGKMKVALNFSPYSDELT